MHRLTHMLLTSILMTLCLSSTDALASLVPANLRCEYQTNPLAIDTPRPRLSWILASDERAQFQSAYQILVASSEDLLSRDRADLWDSGKVKSSEQTHIPYAGLPLASRQRCFWKVRTWDQDAHPSPWSPAATWTMGLLAPSDWKAHWITTPTVPTKSTPLPLFRREFDLTKPISRAEVYVCGLGQFELRLNGQKVGDAVMEPAWTNYRKSALYVTYDVTSLLKPGRNALGALLGNGMYNVVGGRYVKFTGSLGTPKLILQLHITHSDNSSTLIATDSSWKTSPGPITFSCIYGGEDYDARLEQPAWDLPNFLDSSWTPVSLLPNCQLPIANSQLSIKREDPSLADSSSQNACGFADQPRSSAAPAFLLKSQSLHPIKILSEYQTSKFTEPQPSIRIYDLGQNLSGWPKLTVKGPPGTVIKMIPGELLDSTGLVSQLSSGSPVSFSYTLKGSSEESWHPRFSYTGFRYLQVETTFPSSIPNPKLDSLDIRAHFIHNSAPIVGRFECSNPLINQIHRLINAAIRSNFQSVLTDCPHREKLGWLEVSHLMARGILYNYDAATFYAKITADMAAAQTPDGLIPDIAPEYTVFSAGFRDSPEWGSAAVIVPWLIYQTYGDRSLLEKHYDIMKRYVLYLKSKSANHILTHGLGDWYDIGPRAPGESQLTSKGLTATAIYYHDLEILRQTALLLARDSDAREFASLAREVRSAFNAKFFHPESNHYDRNSQTANAMPFVVNLVDDAHRAAVANSLLSNLRSQGTHVTAGDVGFMFLVRALSDAGHSAALYDLVCQPDGPGYAYQLRKNATTLTEAWDANPASSQNHCMLGHVEEWFYSGLAGILPDPSAPGYQRILIKPQIVGDLTWVKAHHDSIRGRIAVQWRRTNNRLTLEVTIPPNTTAEVHIPTSDPTSITESDLPVSDPALRLKLLRQTPTHCIYQIPSGHYLFRSSL
ncbi:MAG: glycoside hydrolase family 78 protein [Bacillota bacterium]